MTIKTRTTALAITLALIASACGGDSSELDTAQAQIDELQEQIEQLADEAAEEEQATQTTTPAPVEQDTTTIAPEPDPVTSEPPAAAEDPEPKPDLEPVDDSAVVPGTPPESVAGFAVPAGPALNGSMTPDEINALVNEITGPTDNLAGQLARIMPFAALTTLPDTEIESFTYWLILDPDSDQQRVRGGVDFLTTARPEDVALSYQLELAELVGGNVSSGIQSNDDTEFHWARVGDYEVVAFESRAVTVVDVSYATSRVPTADEIGAFQGLIDASALDDSGPIEDLQIIAQTNFTDIEVEYFIDGATPDDLQAIEADLIAATGWEFDREVTETTNFYNTTDHGVDKIDVTRFEWDEWGQIGVSFEYDPS